MEVNRNHVKNRQPRGDDEDPTDCVYYAAYAQLIVSIFHINERMSSGFITAL